MQNRNWIANLVPDLALSSLTREVEVPVYLVHNSEDAEDYFFLFNFEEFVDASKSGLFVRPKLNVLAGREDFSRTLFAREFRAVFSQEFDRMRIEVADASQNRGWLSWNFGTNSALDLVTGLAGNLVLYSALFVGRRVFSNVSLPSLFRGKSDEAKLEQQIKRTKGEVEDALSRLAISLHPELYDHAFRDGGYGPRAQLDRDAWPLPQYVRDHLDTGQSGAWW